MELLRLPGGVEAVIRVRSSETGGAFTMLTDSAPAHWRLPMHRHRAESVTIHVTSGAMWMTVGGEARELGPGDTIHIAPGVRHEGGTLGEDPVERVVIFAPGGMEELFEALAATDDPVAMLAAAAQFGWDFS